MRIVTHLKEPNVIFGLLFAVMGCVWNRLFLEMGGPVLLFSLIFRDASLPIPLLVLLLSPLMFLYIYFLYAWPWKAEGKVRERRGLWVTALIVILAGIGKFVVTHHYPDYYARLKWQFPGEKKAALRESEAQPEK